MALFDIPGWSVTTAPVTETSKTESKKRKRPSSESDRLQSAELNLEKLVKRLKGKPASNRDVVPPKEAKTSTGKKKEKKRGKNAGASEETKKTISRPKPLKAAEKGSIPSPRATKKIKTNHEATETASSTNITFVSQEAGLTARQQGMKQSLDGARFRLLNENMYTTDSHQAYQMMRDDPQLFEQYHAGFRHQVQVWPTNPVQHYISKLSKYPPKTVIADLGCGDAALARALIPKGLTVLSFDLVSDGAYVVEADTCDKLPLPGSEGTGGDKSDGEGHVVDIVVCALSLMGTNWPNTLREAWRVLKPDGELKIAEVASRFTDMEEFQSLVGSIGFRFKSKDDSNTHFTLFEFKKIPRKGKNEKEWIKVLTKGNILKPCEYKRR